LVTIWALTLALTPAGALRANPVLTSVEIGPQDSGAVCYSNSVSRTITVNRTGNGNMDIYLSALGLPLEAAASFSPNPLHFAGSAAAATATLVISTAGLLPGSYPLSVIGTDGASPNAVTNTATLDVGVCMPGLWRMADGGLCFAFPSVPGQTYLVQASTNFTSPDWTTLCTTNSGTNNLLVFVDHDRASYPSRFYRNVPQ
jgi:hypothetical protein